MPFASQVRTPLTGAAADCNPMPCSTGRTCRESNCDASVLFRAGRSETSFRAARSAGTPHSGVDRLRLNGNNAATVPNAFSVAVVSFLAQKRHSERSRDGRSPIGYEPGGTTGRFHALVQYCPSRSRPTRTARTGCARSWRCLCATPPQHLADRWFPLSPSHWRYRDRRPASPRGGRP